MTLVCALSVAYASAQTPIATSRLEHVRSEFLPFFALLDVDTASILDDASLQDGVVSLVERTFAEEPSNVHGQAILIAVDLSNRLATRNVDRDQLLARLSRLGYSVDLHNREDTAHVELVFALGILEHARGDMQAARMWFDSTLTFRSKGLQLNSIAAAAKLRGYIHYEEKDYVRAAADFAVALELFEAWGGREDDILDTRSAWAAASVDAGGDLDAALLQSARAYQGLIANDDLREHWTFAYIVYINHARVLGALGRFEEARAVVGAGLSLCLSRGDQSSAAFTRLALARLGLSSKRFSEAIAAAESALTVFTHTRQLNHVAEAHEILEVAHEALGDLAQSLAHARKAHRLRLTLGENSRLESILALQRDYRTANAEHETQLALAGAAQAELERSRATSQRSFLLLAIVFAAGLLALVIGQLHSRGRHSRRLEVEVATRTAELAAQTRKLEAKTRSLEASNKELERFAHITSHDLKTPLRNVTSFLGLVERRMPAEARPAIGEFVGMAQRYAGIMDDLVSGVQKFSNLNGDIVAISSVVDLRTVCTRLVDRVCVTTSPDGGEAVAARTPTLKVLGAARLYGPESFLRQLISELIDNALKYNTAPVPRVTLELFDDAQEVTIRVRDNGIGIAPEYHEQIFEMFKRLHTPDEFAGTGLGLASCRKIVERLGGQIGLVSELGAGSTFTVVLPVVGVRVEGAVGPSEAEGAVGVAIDAQSLLTASV